MCIELLVYQRSFGGQFIETFRFNMPRIEHLDKSVVMISVCQIWRIGALVRGDGGAMPRIPLDYYFVLMFKFLKHSVAKATWTGFVNAWNEALLFAFAFLLMFFGTLWISE